MSKPIVHLLSVAGSDRDLPAQLGLADADAVASLVQDILGAEHQVQLNSALFNAEVSEHRGGRTDDALRAAEINRLISDDQVHAIVSLRGGSWLTRILPSIHFERLQQRTRLLHVFGFSELTTLVNIMATYDCVRAYYDLGAGYLLWGLRNHAAEQYPKWTDAIPVPLPDEHRSAFAWGFAMSGFKQAFIAFFKDVVHMIASGTSSRTLAGSRVHGRIEPHQPMRVIGGCLSTLVPLLGTPFQDRVFTPGYWLALEDVREHPHRIDRYLAQLKLAGIFNHIPGILLGDFHFDGEDQTASVLELLRYHLADPSPPIISGVNFGHCHPMAPVPLRQPLTMRHEPGSGVVQLLPGVQPRRARPPRPGR